MLLVYFTWYYNPTAKISIKKYNGQFIDINATVSKYGDKCSNILATHSLSGCDSVSYPYWKGKPTAFNMMLNSDVDISKFTDPHATEDERLDAGMSFMSHPYYGKK